jgi:hypothetical protein
VAPRRPGRGGRCRPSCNPHAFVVLSAYAHIGVRLRA